MERSVERSVEWRVGWRVEWRLERMVERTWGNILKAAKRADRLGTGCHTVQKYTKLCCEIQM